MSITQQSTPTGCYVFGTHSASRVGITAVPERNEEQVAAWVSHLGDLDAAEVHAVRGIETVSIYVSIPARDPEDPTQVLVLTIPVALVGRIDHAVEQALAFEAHR